MEINRELSRKGEKLEFLILFFMKEWDLMRVPILCDVFIGWSRRLARSFEEVYAVRTSFSLMLNYMWYFFTAICDVNIITREKRPIYIWIWIFLSVCNVNSAKFSLCVVCSSLSLAWSWRAGAVGFLSLSSPTPSRRASWRPFTLLWIRGKSVYSRVPLARSVCASSRVLRWEDGGCLSCRVFYSAGKVSESDMWCTDMAEGLRGAEETGGC